MRRSRTRRARRGALRRDSITLTNRTTGHDGSLRSHLCVGRFAPNLSAFGLREDLMVPMPISMRGLVRLRRTRRASRSASAPFDLSPIWVLTKSRVFEGFRGGSSQKLFSAGISYSTQKMESKELLWVIICGITKKSTFQGRHFDLRSTF